jgi:hypothetical protein
VDAPESPLHQQSRVDDDGLGPRGVFGSRYLSVEFADERGVNDPVESERHLGARKYPTGQKGAINPARPHDVFAEGVCQPTPDLWRAINDPVPDLIAG